MPLGKYITQDEFTALILSFSYATSILIVGETLRMCGVRKNLTRKIVHILAGLWVLPMVSLFPRWQVGIIPFGAFIIVNTVLYRSRLLKSIDSDSPGIIYFAVSITLLFALLWRPGEPEDGTFIALCAVMAMTWGDGLAAIVGETWGSRFYRFGESTRTIEGSIAMFFGTIFGILLAVAYFRGAAVLLAGLASWLLIAAIPAAVATLVEAVSPRGTDNLTVPLFTAVVLAFVS